MVSRCVCGRAVETFRHLFVDCQHVSQVWVHFQRILGMRALKFLTLRALLFHWQRCAPSRHHIRVLLHCFILWQV